MLDMRAGKPQLVSASRHRAGLELTQNGQWNDRILCEGHERVIGCGDDYGVRFCRAVRKAGHLKPSFYANPKGNSLLHFAYAVIWRHWASYQGSADEPRLGPYNEVLLRQLLGGGPYDLEMMLGHSPIVSGSNRLLDFAIAPYRQRLADFNVVHFSLYGIDFYLKTDRRPFPGDWKPYLVNGNDPVFIGRLDDLEWSAIPKLQAIFLQMAKSNWKG